MKAGFRRIVEGGEFLAAILCKGSVARQTEKGEETEEDDEQGSDTVSCIENDFADFRQESGRERSAEAQSKCRTNGRGRRLIRKSPLFGRTNDVVAYFPDSRCRTCKLDLGNLPLNAVNRALSAV